MKLLLDSHVKKAVAGALRKRFPRLDAIHLADWHAGAFLDADDADILAICQAEGRAWLTYDQRTIPDLLRLWAAEQCPHAGVFFADRNSIAPNNVGALTAALAALIREIGDADTTDMVRYLRPATTGY